MSYNPTDGRKQNKKRYQRKYYQKKSDVACYQHTYRLGTETDNRVDSGGLAPLATSRRRRDPATRRRDVFATQNSIVQRSGGRFRRPMDAIQFTVHRSTHDRKVATRSSVGSARKQRRPNTRRQWRRSRAPSAKARIPRNELTEDGRRTGTECTRA